MQRHDAKPAPATCPPRTAQRDGLLFPLIIANVGVLAFGNSLAGEFVFDDQYDIVKNEQVSQLWGSWLPIGGVWRPITSFSFALNYAASKNPLWFHAVNVAIHILAALTLYGIVRRTLSRDCCKARFGSSAS